MNPHTVAEGKRILAVVDDLITDLSVLSCLPPYLSAIPSQDLSHITNQSRGPNGAREAQTQLSEHFDLERKLESAAGDMSADELADHHLSTRALVDTLRQAGYPQYRSVHPPSEAISNFQSIIATLRSLLHDRFNTTVEDDVVKFAILNDTVNREKTASADVQALNREYANEKESRRVEVEKRNVSISKLREEIQLLRDVSETERTNFERVSGEHRTSDQERFAAEFDELFRKVEATEHELKAASAKCQDEETSLRLLRSKKEGALQQSILTYDQDMFASQETLRALQTEHASNFATLQTVEKELAVLNQEADEHMLESQIEEARRTHRVVIQEEFSDFARIIQAYFRSHMVRVNQLSKGKKKKGKKK